MTIGILTLLLTACGELENTETTIEPERKPSQPEVPQPKIIVDNSSGATPPLPPGFS